MVDGEKERAALGHGPVKYHGKWPFVRVYGFQVSYFTSFVPCYHPSCRKLVAKVD